MTRRFLVTGSSGYIGSALTAALSRQGHTVHRQYRDTPLLDDAYEAVLHLAADTLGDYAGNIAYTAALVAKRQPGQRFLFASSLTAQAPVDDYDASKRLGERIIEARSDIHAVILRLGSVYGPPIKANKRSALNQMMTRAVQGENLELYGNSLACRDWVHLSDVVRAFVLALEAPAGVYDVGTGVPHTLADAARLVAAETGVRCDLSPTATDIHHPIATENHWLPGWAPTISLQDGIRQTLDWLRAQGKEERAAGPPRRHTPNPAALLGVAQAV